MANWSRNDTLESSERQLTNGQDFRRFGGLDRRSSYYSYPANIYSLDGCPQGEPYCFVPLRSEEHTSELQSLMRISYAVFCLNKKKKQHITVQYKHQQTLRKN